MLLRGEGSREMKMEAFAFLPFPSASRLDREGIGTDERKKQGLPIAKRKKIANNLTRKQCAPEKGPRERLIRLQS